MKGKILVIAHKPYRFPADPFYIPIHVGSKRADKDEEALQDNIGKNIAIKNDSFCEYSALYWAWKNNFFGDDAYVGFAHYRRYFSGNVMFQNKHILSKDTAVQLLKKYDAIVPKKRHYIIETVYSHYAHAHFQKDMDTVREIVQKMTPDFLPAFDSVMSSRSLHLYNMFVMKKKDFEAYCSWVFPILFEAEKRIDIGTYDPYQKRIFGFVGERLFNVWLKKNRLKTCELPTVNLEGENLLIKGMLMLKRKFFR